MSKGFCVRIQLTPVKELGVGTRGETVKDFPGLRGGSKIKNRK